jgi:hypothetical protein
MHAETAAAWMTVRQVVGNALRQPECVIAIASQSADDPMIELECDGAAPKSPADPIRAMSAYRRRNGRYRIFMSGSEREAGPASMQAGYKDRASGENARPVKTVFPAGFT